MGDEGGEMNEKSEILGKELEKKIEFYESEKSKILDKIKAQKSDQIDKHLKSYELMIFHLRKLKFGIDEIKEKIRKNFVKNGDLKLLLQKQSELAKEFDRIFFEIGIRDEQIAKLLREKKEIEQHQHCFQKEINEISMFVEDLGRKLKELEEIDLGDGDVRKKLQKLFEVVMRERDANRMLGVEINDLIKKNRV